MLGLIWKMEGGSFSNFLQQMNCSSASHSGRPWEQSILFSIVKLFSRSAQNLLSLLFTREQASVKQTVTPVTADISVILWALVPRCDCKGFLFWWLCLCDSPGLGPKPLTIYLPNSPWFFFFAEETGKIDHWRWCVPVFHLRLLSTSKNNVPYQQNTLCFQATCRHNRVDAHFIMALLYLTTHFSACW